MIEIKGLSFTYGDGKRALDGIDLDIKRGEFVLLTGASGSGKSTLVRCLNGLVPSFYGGRLEGSVIVEGRDASNTPTNEMAWNVSMVFQDPESMFVSSETESEIAFAPSSLGYTRSETNRAVGRILTQLGIGHLRKRSLQDLSGGEKQKVALASVLVTQPKVLVLDEPLSELDHESAEKLMDSLKKLNEKGMTIIIIEQRTEKVCGYTTREIVLEQGKVAYDGAPKKNGELIEAAKVGVGEVLVDLGRVSFSYGENHVFESFSQSFHEGELVVLEGANGSGKTTLLKLIMGLLRADAGVVNVGGLENPSVEETAGAVGYVFQNPDNHLFAETVKEEVEFILRNTERDGDVDGILKDFGVLHYMDTYPRYLSGGEKQRVALASILVARPKVLLLDEPTRGMDYGLKKRLAEYLLHYIKKGNLVIMATHDDYMAGCATRRVKL